MPLVFRAAIKPTPSIARAQESVNLNTMEPETLTISGRHDPCIVPRAVPVMEAAAALAISDLILGESSWN
jgi:chorismate synthase